ALSSTPARHRSPTGTPTRPGTAGGPAGHRAGPGGAAPARRAIRRAPPHGPGHDVTIGRYLTPETIRLGLSGLAAGSAAGLAWRAAGRVRWGGVPFLLAVVLAARYTGRSDWPRWDPMAAGAAFVVVLAGVGAARLLGDSTVGWAWVAAGALVSAAGVGAGVAETGPVLLAGGALTGLAATAALTRSRWAPTAGAGVAAVVGWAALSGAAGRPWAAL